MLVHISGPSGPGKTTLANELKLNKKLVVIDLDDIDDNMR
jgi:adenylate kinase family enzyme